MFSKFSIKRPFTIFVAVVLVIVLGVISFTKMPTDLLPSMDLPYVAVVTTYPGANPEKVELSVTRPLEQTLSTTSGIENVTSTSSENMSLVLLQFVQGTNMDSAMIELSGKLDLVKGQLDDAVSSPSLMKINPDMLPLFVASVDMDGSGITDTSSFTEEEIIPALERIDGVASITATGLIENQLRITLNQKKIDALNDKVLASVDSRLAEGKEQLQQARAELEANKALLADGKLDELAQAGIAIADGKAQLQSAIQQITQAQAELPGQLDQLRQAKELIDRFSEEGMVSYGELSAQINATQKELYQLNRQVEENTSLLEEKNARLQELQQELEELTKPGQNDQPDTGTGETPSPPEDTEGRIEAIRQEIAALSEEAALLNQQLLKDKAAAALLTARLELLDSGRQALNEITASLEDLLGSLTDSTSLTDLSRQLEEGIAQIEQAQAELPAQKAELQQQLQALEQQQQEVESGKLSASLTMGEASAQLSLAEQTLNEQEAAFEEARDQAFQQANLDGIITQAMISGILAGENFSMPAGYLTEGTEQYAVKVGDPFASVEELKELVLFTVDAGGVGKIRLSDVADIAYADNSGETYTKINGNDGILLTFQKQSIASTAEVSQQIRDTIGELEAAYPGLHITALSDQGIYIDIVIDSVLQNLWMGGLLAIVILFLFLRKIKPTFIVAVSIPISVLFALAMMYFSGVTLNVVSLAGLALGIGMLVDNSIVVIENIYRMRAQGVPIKEAAVKGATQVGGAIAASTLTTICVFLPIVFTEGMARELFVDMGLTIAYSLIASLLIAMTLVPALAYQMPGSTEMKPLRWFERFQNGYGRLLEHSLKHKAVTLAIVLALLGLSIFGATRMGTAFMPEMDENQIGVTLEMPPDSTTEETRDMSDQVVDLLAQIPGIETIGAMQGGGMLSASSGGRSVSLYVLLDENRSASSQEISRQILELTAGLPCTVHASGGSQNMLSATGSGVQVDIRGEDLDELQRIALDIARLVEDTEGTENVSNGMEENAEETRVTVDKNQALSYGLTVAQVYQAVAAAIQNETTATTLNVGNTGYPVIVAKDTQNTLTREDLSGLQLTGTRDGAEIKVALGEIAQITQAEGLSSIRHDGQTRYLSVTAGIDSSHNIGLVSRQLQARLNGYEVPEGYTVEITGENESINEILSQLITMILLAVVLIYLIMVAQFQSLLSPFIVMFTIPLAFTGGLLLLWACGFELSAVAMMGFLVLAGVVVNNGIVFVDYANQMKESGLPQREALILTGRTRLRPILMTALTTILGLLTLAMGIGTGSDLLQPMAVVTIGGLTYATLLTLFVVPILYDIFHLRGRKQGNLPAALPREAEEGAAQSL